MKILKINTKLSFNVNIWTTILSTYIRIPDVNRFPDTPAAKIIKKLAVLFFDLMPF